MRGIVQREGSGSVGAGVGGWEGLPAFLLAALPVGLAVLFGLRCLDDPDPWWHLASGRWIASHAAVPRTDPLSFTVSDHPWINVQWLFDLVLYAAFQAGGVTLLIIATAIAYGSGVALLVKNLRRSVGPVAACVLASWATCVAQERFTIRPEMVSFVLLQLLIWLLATTPRHDGRRLWLMLPLMTIWANTHSLFIIGILLIGAYFMTILLMRTRFLPVTWRRSWALTPTAERRVVLFGVLASLATLVNPYGVDGALFPIELASRIDGSNPVFAAINEFRSPWSTSQPSLALDAYRALLTASVGVVALAALLTAVAQPGPDLAASPPAVDLPSPAESGRFHAAHLLFFVALAYLSVLARRNMALFAMGAMPFVAECLVVVHAALPPLLHRSCAYAAKLLTPMLPAALGLFAWFVMTNGFYRWELSTHEFGVGVQEAQFPIRAVAFARELQLPARLYNDLGMGGYLTWDPPVAGGVYMDGRLEVYGADFFGAYMTAVSDPALWQTEADHRGINTVVMDYRWDAQQTLPKYLLGDTRWALVYYDEVVVVFVRRPDDDARTERARALFSERNRELKQRLLTAQSSWQWQTGKIVSLWNYSSIAMLVGESDTAVACWNEILTLDPPPFWELQMRMRLAHYYWRAGQVQAARPHVLRAADLSPGNTEVRQLLTQIGN